MRGAVVDRVTRLFMCSTNSQAGDHQSGGQVINLDPGHLAGEYCVRDDSYSVCSVCVPRPGVPRGAPFQLHSARFGQKAWGDALTGGSASHVVFVL